MVKLLYQTHLLIKVNKEAMNIKWLFKKTKGVGILGRYIELDEIDKKIIVFDFSGNEIYR